MVLRQNTSKHSVKENFSSQPPTKKKRKIKTVVTLKIWPNDLVVIHVSNIRPVTHPHSLNRLATAWASEHQMRLTWARGVTGGWQCCLSETKREHTASPLLYFSNRSEINMQCIASQRIKHTGTSQDDWVLLKYWVELSEIAISVV